MTVLGAAYNSAIGGSDLDATADVLVLGGGPAGVWAALTAAASGASVVLAEKGFVGTGGATAAGNTTTIYVAPRSEEREIAIRRRIDRGFGLAERPSIERAIDEAYIHLNELADWGYPYPVDESGRSYRGSLRGADYLRLMRRRLRKAGVGILDQSPALELLLDGGVAAGAAGIDRKSGRTSCRTWTVRAGAVVVATGGCAFLSKALGTNGLTGDGHLMAAEAGAIFSGMEFAGQYGLCPAFSSVTKGIIYFWATFTDEDGNEIARAGDHQSIVARRLIDGPVYAVIDRAPPRVQEGMRKGQPNIFVPFDRLGIDPFTQRFPVTLRYEGTVRGVGGLLVDEACATTVAGLYAAGDTTSRERFVGATSGGGGPNASWAMASGARAGHAAAAFAFKEGRSRAARAVRPAGGTGLRPAGAADRALTPDGIIAAVQQEILPLDRNFFRTGSRLASSLARLDDLWRQARNGLLASRNDVLQAREAAAMLASARWIIASARERRESRGMHRRLDYPGLDHSLQHRLLVEGLEQVRVRPVVPAAEAVAS
jgi:succinate dehydrogenase/fumarate reductase flavoprotein subunit